MLKVKFRCRIVKRECGLLGVLMLQRQGLLYGTNLLWGKNARHVDAKDLRVLQFWGCIIISNCKAIMLEMNTKASF